MIDVNILYSVIFIKMPEGFLLIFMILTFLNNNKFFDIKNMVKLTLIITIPYLMVDSILIYMNLENYIKVILSSLEVTILIFLMLKHPVKGVSTKGYILNIFKIYILSLICFAILGLIESIEIFLLKYLFNFDIFIINRSILVDFTIAMPTKIIVFFMVYLKYIKINIRDSLILKIVWGEKSLFRGIICVQIILNMIVFIFIYNNFVIEDILNKLEPNNQFFIVFLLFFIILIEIILPWIILLTLKLKQGRKLGEDS